MHNSTVNEDKKGDVFLTTCPDPFQVRNVSEKVPFGLTISDMVLHAVPRQMASLAYVWIDGHYIPPVNWHRVRPKSGAIVTIKIVPGKGGGKNPLASVLTLAVMIAAPYAGAALAQGLGLGWTAGGSFISSYVVGGISSTTLMTGVVSVVGKLAVNAIAPPSKPRAASAVSSVADNPTLFVTGAKNQTLRFGSIPVVLGKMRIVPPYAAKPYTETVGGDQYVRMLFCLGYGPLEISDLKIGETPLSEFDGVEVEVREGFDDDDPVTLYPKQVDQNDLNITLKQADGYHLRTTERDVDEISVDITFPRGLSEFANNSTKKSRTVQLEVQYAPTGTSDWSSATGSYKAISATVSPEMPKPSAYYYRKWVPTHVIYRVYMNPANGSLSVIRGSRYRPYYNDQPDEPIVPPGMLKIARVERVSDDPDTISSDRITDERDLSKVGDYFESVTDFVPSTSGTDNRISIAAGGVTHPGIKVTDKKSTAIRENIKFKVDKGQYDVRVRRISSDTNSDQIFDQTVWTALRSIKNEAPVHRSGLALVAMRIKATDQLNGVVDQFNCIAQSIVPDWNGSTWIEQATSNPASLYRHVLQGSANARALDDDRINLDKLADWHEDCAEAGREFNYSVDRAKPVALVLDDIAAAGRAARAIIDGKWTVIQDKLQIVPRQHFTPRNSYGFQGERVFSDLPHGFRVRFLNRHKGWQPDEIIVYDDGYDENNATKFEGLEPVGITDPDHAWKDGRYHIATARLRPETFSFNSDVEHIVCTRGDLIRLTHDVMLVGLGSGRIKSVIDDGASITGFNVDETFVMQSGKDYSVQIRTAGGSFLSLPVNTIAGSTNSVTLKTPYDLGDWDGGAGDLIVFGITGKVSMDCIVRSIEPQSNLSARITCVPAAPEIHDADQGNIPAYDSKVTIPADLQRPPIPVVSNIQTGDEVLIRNPDGSFSSTITLTLAPYQFEYPLSVGIKIKASSSSYFKAANFIDNNGLIRILDVEAGEYYDVILVYKTQIGISSEEKKMSSVLVTGATGHPGTVDGFSVNILGDAAYLSWDSLSDIDLSHYRIKWSPATEGATWASSIVLVDKVSVPATSVTVEALSGTYLIKGVDYGGRESEAATIAVSTVAAISGFNAVEALSEAPEFEGQKDGVGVVDGALRLTGADSIDDWTNIDEIASFDIGAGGLLEEGTYSFSEIVDLGQVYTSRVKAALTVDGINLLDNFDTIENVDAIDNFDSSVAPSNYEVILQISKTNDDPDGSPQWTSWQPFVVGDYTARAYRFRVILRRLVAGVTPKISALSVTVDMPDRDEAGRNISSDPAGSNVDFAYAFRAIPAIAVTGNDMATGDYFEVTGASTTGFTIRFFNAAGTGISRNFDFVAKGYGKVD